MSSWRLVFLAGIISALLPVCAPAQLVGGFSLSKTAYLAGEPVFLFFTVKNVGSEPLLIRTADPLSSCSGYQFALTGARDRYAMRCGGSSSGIFCASSNAMLEPGKSHTDRILLNERYDLRQPGSYPLRVTYRLNYRPADKDPASSQTSSLHQDFQDELEILIEPSQPRDLKTEFAQYARDLDSKDAHAKIEAAKVIAYLAPRFMEPVIIKMLDTPTLQYYGVEGLRNVGTPSAHRELANFVKKTPPTNVAGAYQAALRYLGEIGDRSDISVLLDAAGLNAPDSSSRELAIESAGEAGGAAAVPMLVAELKNPSVNTRQAAVRALYLTGSRAAVPVLISLLPSQDWRVSLTAEYGLEVLTHRGAASTKLMKPPPPDIYEKWTRWWKLHGATATIYKYDQCGTVVPLRSP